MNLIQQLKKSLLDDFVEVTWIWNRGNIQRSSFLNKSEIVLFALQRMLQEVSWYQTDITFSWLKEEKDLANEWDVFLVLADKKETVNLNDSIEQFDSIDKIILECVHRKGN